MHSATDQKFVDNTIDCFQHVIKQYIERQLQSGSEASQVKSDMEKLYRDYLVIPEDMWGWTMKEIERENKKITKVNVVQPAAVVRKERSSPSLFSKDTLYHASLCCEAINTDSETSPTNPLYFFQNKKPHHDLSEVSFSQSRDNITPYLIARQRDVVYVAFRGTSSISKWLESAPSFSEGIVERNHTSPHHPRSLAFPLNNHWH